MPEISWCYPVKTYLIRVWIDSDFCVYAADLPCCASQGDSIEHCLEMIEDAFRGVAESYLEDNGHIPFVDGGDRPPFHEERRLVIDLSDLY